MSDKVEFPGGWAKLRDPEDVPERLRRPLAKVQRHLLGSGVGDVLIQREAMGEVKESDLTALIKPVLASDDWELLDDSGDYLIVALVEEWSFEFPISIETVQGLPGRAYKALRAECDPLLGAVLGNPGDDDLTDPDSK